MLTMMKKTLSAVTVMLVVIGLAGCGSMAMDADNEHVVESADVLQCYLPIRNIVTGRSYEAGPYHTDEELGEAQQEFRKVPNIVVKRAYCL